MRLALLVVTLMLAACRGTPPPATDTPPVLPTATAPAPTTAAPPAPTEPAAPSATPAAETSPTPGGEAATATPVVSGAESSPSPAPTSPPGTAGTNLVEFVADVTVPDGTDFEPGEAFSKTWQVRNAGTATWTTAYALVFVSGDQMGGPASITLPAEVPPGQTVDLTVDLVAPEALGTYTGFWMLRNAAGVAFGLSAEGNQPIYVQIDVVPAGAVGTAPPAGTAGALSVTAAELSVAQATITGTCPQTFEFSGSYTSQGAGTVTYRLEASADTPGFVFTLPGTNTATFTNAGPRTASVGYSLEFTGSVSGQVWLHILTPNELESNKVSFSLTCQP